MKALLISLFPIVDFLLQFIIIPAAICLKLFRKISPARVPFNVKALEKIGVWPITRHYYQPLIHPDDLRHDLRKDRNLPGLDLNERGQLALLKKFNFSQELQDLKWHENQGELQYNLNSPSFNSGDAETLYNVIRHYKPKKLIEIGSGHSTIIAQYAISKNSSELKCKHICIEPYEMHWLEKLGPTILRKKVEECGDLIIESLESGDILFIDSSHMIRPQGDVLFEYLEILPQLKSGVIVHVHDIFTPKDYPSEWLFGHKKLWNEQYLLEAILSNTSRYEIVLAGNYLHHNHFEEFKRTCPYLNKEREPGSFYFKVK